MNRLKKTIKLNNIIIGLVLAGSLLVTGCNSNKEELSSDIIKVDEIAPRCSECNNQMQGQKENKKFVCVNPSCDKFEDTIEFSDKDLSVLLEASEEDSKEEVRKVQCDECGVMFVPEEGKSKSRCNKCKTAYDKSIKEQETDYLYNKKCSSCGTQFTTTINTDTKCYDCYNNVEEEQQNDSTSSMLEPKSNYTEKEHNN